MSTALRISEDTRSMLEVKAKVHRRSLAGQADYYIRLGILAEENPELPLLFIREILEGRAEADAGMAEEYRFGVLR
jgi:hypothetical protein